MSTESNQQLRQRITELESEREDALNRLSEKIGETYEIAAQRDEAKEIAADLSKRLEQMKRDAETNQEICRMQAQRIRQLLARLGEPHAPEINLPSNN